MQFTEFSNRWADVKPKVSGLYANCAVIPVAKYVAYGLLRLRVSPNGASVLAALLVVAAGLLVVASFAAQYWLFMLLATASYIVDHSDGAIARITNRTSRFGAMLDVFLDRLNVLYLLGIVGLVYVRRDVEDELLQVLFWVGAFLYVAYQLASSMQALYFPDLRGYMSGSGTDSIVRKLVQVAYEGVDTGLVYLALGLGMVSGVVCQLVAMVGLVSAVLLAGMLHVLYTQEAPVSE